MTEYDDSVEEVPIAGQDEANNTFKLFQAINDGPAFVRRARAVEAALEGLLGKARQQRDDWLRMPQLRLGMLHALIDGNWNLLRPHLDNDETILILARLHEDLQPRRRISVQPTGSARRLRRGLTAVRDSLALFNRRWSAFLSALDLRRVNELRDGYNRYFVLEKECALRSARVAREGFVPLPPLTIQDLLKQLPLLPAL